MAATLGQKIGRQEPGTSITSYEIVHTAAGWALLNDGKEVGVLDTRMAAFDSAYAAAGSAILSGHGVTIKVPHAV